MSLESKGTTKFKLAAFANERSYSIFAIAQIELNLEQNLISDEFLTCIINTLDNHQPLTFFYTFRIL